MRISDWSSDVCSSDLIGRVDEPGKGGTRTVALDDDRFLGPTILVIGVPTDRRRDVTAQPDQALNGFAIVLRIGHAEFAERAPDVNGSKTVHEGQSCPRLRVEERIILGNLARSEEGRGREEGFKQCR